MIFTGKGEQRTAYRFLSNPRVGVQDIVDPHQDAMAGRCRSRPVVPFVQDTTMLNYSGLAATSGLVGLGGGSGSIRLAARAGVAFSEGGCAQGVFSLDVDFRSENGGTGAKHVQPRIRMQGERMVRVLAAGPLNARGNERRSRESRQQCLQMPGRRCPCATPSGSRRSSHRPRQHRTRPCASGTRRSARHAA